MGRPPLPREGELPPPQVGARSRYPQPPHLVEGSWLAHTEDVSGLGGRNLPQVATQGWHGDFLARQTVPYRPRPETGPLQVRFLKSPLLPHTTLFGKPRAQPRHREHKGESTGCRRATREVAPITSPSVPTLFLPRSFESSLDGAQAAVGPAPAPAPRAREQVWSSPCAPPARPQASHRHPLGSQGRARWVRSQCRLSTSGSRTPRFLPTGFVSCPHGTGTRVLPSADHPTAPPWPSLPPLLRDQHSRHGGDCGGYRTRACSQEAEAAAD